MARQYPDALPTGYALQEYTIRRVLGQGGFGITYLAYDEGLAKEVAIKEYFPVEFAARRADDTVTPRSDADDDDYDWGLTRFQEEARTLVLFRHPAIVPVYRRFEENGTAYMVMEYQVGESLSELMKRHLDDFTEKDLMNIAEPVLDGLVEVHKAGYLHRDLKPGNIYIRRDGTPVLLDFGAARAAVGHKSRSLTSIVTPGYAPLEQYFAEGNQGPWTDIYAFAAMLYQCVCGKLPPEAPARVRKDTMVSAVEAAGSRFSGEFLSAIDKGLSINEEDRPQNVAAWLQLLKGRSTVEAERRPDETVALAGGGRQRASGLAATPASQAGHRQEPSFRQPPPQTPSDGRSGSGGRAQAGRIAVFALAGIMLAGAGAAGGWLVVGGSGNGSDGTNITDGIGGGGGGGGSGNGTGNGGGGGTDASLTPEQKRQRALEEARRKAQQEAERRRLAEEERKRKAEAERKQKAVDERKRKAEDERKRKAEAERKRKAEAERKRRAEAERKRKADAERKRKAEAERKRRQREEAERRRQEAEAKRRRKQREEEERRRRERELAARNRVVCPYLARGIRSATTTRRDCGMIAATYVQALTNGYAGVTRSWRNRKSGARGTITILRSIKRADGTFCRVFQQTVIYRGQYRRSTGTACLFGNRWRIVG